MGKQADGDYLPYCGDKVFGRILIGFVLVAAWLTDFGGRRKS